MIKYICPQCNTEHHLKNIRKRVFCSCGGIAHNPEWAGVSASSYGPGDAMTEITREFGLQEKQGCYCRTLAKKMNEWDIDGCEQNREYIVSELKCNAEKYSLTEKVLATIRNIHKPFAISLAISGDVYNSVLDEAIRRTKEKCAKA